jgi:hypothetical protein
MLGFAGNRVLGWGGWVSGIACRQGVWGYVFEIRTVGVVWIECAGL